MWYPPSAMCGTCGTLSDRHACGRPASRFHVDTMAVSSAPVLILARCIAWLAMVELKRSNFQWSDRRAGRALRVPAEASPARAYLGPVSPLLGVPTGSLVSTIPRLQGGVPRFGRGVDGSRGERRVKDCVNRRRVSVGIENRYLGRVMARPDRRPRCCSLQHMHGACNLDDDSCIKRYQRRSYAHTRAVAPQGTHMHTSRHLAISSRKYRTRRPMPRGPHAVHGIRTCSGMRAHSIAAALHARTVAVAPLAAHTPPPPHPL